MLKNLATKVYERNIVSSAGRAIRTNGPGKHQAKRSSSVYIPRIARRSQDEILDHIRQARIGWEQGILEELRAIIYESRRPFLVIR